mgnify:FL=1
MISIIIITVLLILNLFTFLCLVQVEQENNNLLTLVEESREMVSKLIKTGEKS